jgi:hypothetical protein
MWLRPAAVAASDAERRPPGLFLGSQRQADYKRLRLAGKMPMEQCFGEISLVWAADLDHLLQLFVIMLILWPLKGVCTH